MAFVAVRPQMAYDAERDVRIGYLGRHELKVEQAHLYLTLAIEDTVAPSTGELGCAIYWPDDLVWNDLLGPRALSAAEREALEADLRNGLAALGATASFVPAS